MIYMFNMVDENRMIRRKREENRKRKLRRKREEKAKGENAW